MADIKVKNNANTEVVLRDVDTIIVPTSDGGTAVYRKWNGVQEVTSKSSAVCLNSFVKSIVQSNAISTSVGVALTI